MSRLATFGTHVLSTGGHGRILSMLISGDAVDFTIAITDSDDLEMAHWNDDASALNTQRSGIWLGPRGIPFQNGLKIVLTNNGAGTLIEAVIEFEEFP